MVFCTVRESSLHSNPSSIVLCSAFISILTFVASDKIVNLRTHQMPLKRVSIQMWLLETATAELFDSGLIDRVVYKLYRSELFACNCNQIIVALIDRIFLANSA